MQSVFHIVDRLWMLWFVQVMDVADRDGTMCKGGPPKILKFLKIYIIILMLLKFSL